MFEIDCERYLTPSLKYIDASEESPTMYFKEEFVHFPEIYFDYDMTDYEEEALIQAEEMMKKIQEKNHPNVLPIKSVEIIQFQNIMI